MDTSVSRLNNADSKESIFSSEQIRFYGSLNLPLFQERGRRVDVFFRSRQQIPRQHDPAGAVPAERLGVLPDDGGFRLCDTCDAVDFNAWIDGRARAPGEPEGCVAALVQR